MYRTEKTKIGKLETDKGRNERHSTPIFHSVDTVNK